MPQFRNVFIRIPICSICSSMALTCVKWFAFNHFTPTNYQAMSVRFSSLWFVAPKPKLMYLYSRWMKDWTEADTNNSFLSILSLFFSFIFLARIEPDCCTGLRTAFGSAINDAKNKAPKRHTFRFVRLPVTLVAGYGRWWSWWYNWSLTHL